MSYIGNGTLLCRLENQSIQALSLYGLPSFLSLKADLTLPSRIDRDTCLHENAFDCAYDGSVQIYDFMRSGCFFRYIQSTKPFVLDLTVSSHCKEYWYPACQINRRKFPCLLLSMPPCTPTSNGFCTKTEGRMLITLLGDGRFSEDGRQIFIDQGRGTLLFVTGQTGQLLSLASKQIDFLENTDLQLTIQQKKHSFCEQSVSDSLQKLISHTGGSLSHFEDQRVFLSDMPLIGSAFLQQGDLTRAKLTATFLLSRFSLHGYLPLVMHPLYPPLCTEETGSEQVHYPAVCHFFLDLAVHVETALAGYLKSTATLLFLKTKAALVQNTLCFSSTEFPMRRGYLPPQLRFHGNFTATAQYVHLAHRLGRSEQAPIPAIKSRLLESLRKNPPSIPYGTHRLQNTHPAQAVYGFCPSCTHLGWLNRSDSDSYLCLDCLEKGRTECILTDNLPILPGEYAVCLEHLCRAECIDKEEFYAKLEICGAHITDLIPFHDLALLCQYDFSTRNSAKEKLETMLHHRNAPLGAAEAAAYLLSNQKSEMP